VILDVLMGGSRAGRLDLTRPNAPVFTYDSAYMSDASATPLSTLLPLIAERASGSALRRWLEGLLPDNSQLLSSRLGEHGLHFYHRVKLLGTTMGEECAGAVQFCPPDRAEALLAGEGGMDPISDDAVLDWMANLRDDPAYRPDPYKAMGGFSLGGVQPKIALRRTDTGWAVPWGAEPSSHIIKVTRSDPYPHESLLEHIALATAARMGLTAAGSKVISNGDVEGIVVRRFDRLATAQGLVRVHQEDLCQALGYPPDLKYQHLGGPTPAEIASKLHAVDDPGSTRSAEAFRDMLAFQWLIVGNDAHAKNYGLLLSGRSSRLAPLYDACSWIPYRRADQEIADLSIAMTVGASYEVAAADQPTAILDTADNLQLPPVATAERFEELASLMPDALEATVRSLPAASQALPIVSAYLTEQTQRAIRCAQIAADAARLARSRRQASTSDVRRS
jgi:serine/threonine-protein kinase HipA